MPTWGIVIRYAGDSALLVETGSQAAAHRLRAALEEAAPAGVRETVVGAGSVLVLVDPLGCDLASVRRIAGTVAGLSGDAEDRTRGAPDSGSADRAPDNGGAPDSGSADRAPDNGGAGARRGQRGQRGQRVVRVPVRYDGADLEEVAALTGLPVAEVVRRHAAATYTVAFTGFAPGFGYLTGIDPALQVPRRDSPRERVPAGAVAIAGVYSAVYPQPTPGGWRLLGHTTLGVFDPARTPPALLAPGDLVRFEPLPGR